MKHLKENQLLNWAIQKEQNKLADTAGMHFINFTAETRSSGVNLADGTKIRKGAFDAIRNMVNKAGNTIPKETEEKVKTISANGGTPLVVVVNNEVKGVIELQDIIKPGIQERFERLAQNGCKDGDGNR